MHTAACSSNNNPATPSTSAATSSATPTPTPEPTPTPTPAPTPTPPPAAAPFPAPNCTGGLADTSQAAPVGGGSFAASLSLSGPGCPAWTLVSSVPWITITSAASGGGPASISYRVAANSDALERTGMVIVQFANNQTTRVLVTEAPITTCTYALSQSSQDVGGIGGPFSVDVTRNTPNGCSWAAASSVDWITIPGAPSGDGNSKIGYAVAENRTGVARTGTIIVSFAGGTATLRVNQAAETGM